MKIAYLVNTCPRASHRFIRREAQAVERLGLQVHRYAMRSDRATRSDPGDIAKDARTGQVPETGIGHLLAPGPGWMVRHPLRAVAALRPLAGPGIGGLSPWHGDQHRA